MYFVDNENKIVWIEEPAAVKFLKEFYQVLTIEEIKKILSREQKKKPSKSKKKSLSKIFTMLNKQRAAIKREEAKNNVDD